MFDTYKYVGNRAKGYDTWLKAQEAKYAERTPKKPQPPRKE